MNQLNTALSLNGKWTLALDPEDRGVRECWPKEGPPDDAVEVDVPAVWDLWVPDYDGVGWYFKTFSLDDSWQGRRAALHFDAVNYFAEVWLNGKRAGEHEGGYTPFTLEVSALVKSGDNLLAVRVVDPKGPEGWGPFHPKELPIAKETGYWSFGGIWGGVRLEATAHTYIQDVFIKPDIQRGRVLVDVAAVSEPGRQIRLTVGGTSFAVVGAPGTLRVDMPDFRLWSPERPHLYTLHAELLGEDGPVHAVSTRFGMREFTVKENRFFLNNRPIHLKGVLHQPDYARSLAAPESAELARREIDLAREAGFNMMRLHIKPAPPITLDLADEMGMLLYEEPSIGWIQGSARMRDRCMQSLREMVLRDRNHPSVVIWGMLNETGNAGYITGGGAQTVKEELALEARALDPTRLIIDDSAGVNATREPSRFLRPYGERLTEFDDLHIYQRAPVDLDIENYYRHNGDPSMLVTVSEFGFGGPEDLEDVIAQYGDDPMKYKDARFLQKMLDACNQGFAERSLDRIFGDFAGLARAARELQCDAALMQIDAMRANPKIAGYCYTQLADAGHEFCAGVADRWRRPKPALKALAAAQQPVRPIIQIPETNLSPRQEIPVTVLLANEERIEGRGEVSLQLVGPTGQVLWKKKRAIAKIPKHGRELWEGTVSASGSCGPHKFVVRLLRDNRIIASAESDLYVVEPAPVRELSIHLLDPHGEWAGRCRPLAGTGNLMAPVHVIPPLANTIRAYPDNELAQILAQVRGGAVAIFFGPPDDWNDLAERLGGELSATPKDAVGCFLPAMHYVKVHPVFDGLPSRCLMRQPYRNVIPEKTFLETGEEDICGTFDTTPIAAGNYMFGETRWWGTDILVRRHGAGRIVLTHLRVLENLGQDPMADRVFTNLINHFTRRSVPPGQPLPPDQRTVEWMRAERNNNVRRWMVIGEFPNWNQNAGHNTAYPPETVQDFDATYPGWYKAVRWRRWYSRAQEGHLVDLQTACSPVFQYYPKFDRAVAYAHAEFVGERRQAARLVIGVQDAMKVWMNGMLVFETDRQVPHDQFETETVPVNIRQGRNTLLVKCSKIPGPFKFSLNLESAGTAPLAIKWWK
ncbi:MAG: hypothetical protein H3C30_05150 [Candidatus Hydrogenedentes bacterium]|nr:hypothetical protein [Candidatus Hydrogenedentota bacterium]